MFLDSQFRQRYHSYAAFLGAFEIAPSDSLLTWNREHTSSQPEMLESVWHTIGLELGLCRPLGKTENGQHRVLETCHHHSIINVLGERS